jgi:general L-amino acid transport system permease protein
MDLRASSEIPVIPVDGFEIDPTDDGPKLPPVEPAIPPGKWIKDNLFSSIGSGILTVVFGIIAFSAFRALLNFAFHNPSRKWAAVPTNIRLLMTQAYPAEQYSRVWVSVGIIAVLAGLTVGIGRSESMVSLRKMLTNAMATGVAIIVAALLIKNNLQSDPETGEFIRNEAAEVLRVGRGEALSGRWWVFLIGALLLGGGLAATFILGDRRRFIFYRLRHVGFAVLGLLALSLWVVPYGNYGLVDGVFIAEKGVTVANSTKLPWTVMWILLGIGFFVGRYALPSKGAAKTALYLGWLLSPYVIIFVILRDPTLDYNRVLSVDLPWFLFFAVVGGAILWLLTKPDLGEPGRAGAFVLMLFAIFNWVAGFFGWYGMLQKNRLGFLVLALFALAASNFAGDSKLRRGYVFTWIGSIAILHYLITMVNTESTLQNVQSDSFIGGFLLTLVLAVFGLTLSFPLGVLLALARTSDLPIFRLLSTTFIEVSRGIPLITVLFFFATVIPLFLPEGMAITKLAAAVVALVIFSAAYVAENIRGGLQSIRRGQFEAADAVGLSTAQRIGLIILPQGLRVSIPPLVGQAIATYKETSLIAIIGLFDFLLIANSVIPTQNAFRGQRFEPLLFVSVVYWVGAYSMSRYSRSLEKRLGVGTR